MTELHVERFCPYHGGFVALATCPVVATNERTNFEAHRRLGVDPGPRAQPGGGSVDAALGGSSEQEPGDDAARDTPRGESEGRPTGPPRPIRVEAARTPPVGYLAQSRIDGLRRLVVAHGPGIRQHKQGLLRPPPRIRETLPSPAELAEGYGGVLVRPARACPRCLHPLPVTIDHRDAYPVAIAGHTGASKTTTIVALIEEANQLGPEALGVESFSATESTINALRARDPDIFAKYRRRQGPTGTSQELHAPLEFLTSLPNGIGEASVLVQDASGEDLVQPDLRLERARAVLWSDAVLFIYNPEDSPLLRSETMTRNDQAVLLNGIRDDLETRAERDPSGRRYTDPPLIVAVSKADLLPDPPDVRSGPAPPDEVEQALRGLRDASVLAAARRWPEVHWRFVAPLPQNGGEPQGVADLFKLLLSLLGR